ncbi:hypothetical protein BDY24DRAFT_385678 [Mrakia frigida]|uniref:uncharacterized protein n=1 Tax=Mrakia frigida TaxID=29902 RepID=UPI003FCC1850
MSSEPTPTPPKPQKYNLRQLDVVRPDGMLALSRGEEEELRKNAKLSALKACDPLVKAFADCSTGRTFSVVWACKDQLKTVNDCVRPLRSEEHLDKLRMEFLSEDARKARRYAAVEKTKGHNSPYTK